MSAQDTGTQYAGLTEAERAAAMVDPHISKCDAPTIDECTSCTGRLGIIRRILKAAGLHRWEQERDELIAKTARLSVAAGQAHRERDLARAELASALAELAQLRAELNGGEGPMTASKLIGSTHGFDLFGKPGEVAAWRGSELAGVALAAVLAKPGGRWFGRKRGEDAVPFDTRRAAIAHIVGCRPEDVPDAAGGDRDA